MKPVYNCLALAITMVLAASTLAAPQLGNDLAPRADDFPPKPYAFSYTIRDEIQGVLAARVEEQDAQGIVKGSYTYVRPDGIISTTSYVADKDGFRSETKEEPANGLEAPNPNGNIQVSVKLPDTEEFGYQFTAQEYREILQQAARQRQTEAN